jgi:WD40 repeat protein
VNVEPSAVYVDESTIAYVVGVNVVLFNTESKSQRYLNVIEQPNASVTALAANPANKLLAVAIKSDKPSIAIFDLQVMKRRKVMSLGEGSVKVTVSNDLFDINNKEFVSLAFSADAKFLASQSGSPDWTSTFWSCERGKPLASWKASSQTISADATATRVSFNPNDSSHICVTGFCTMRFFRYLDNQLKPVASRHETKVSKYSRSLLVMFILELCWAYLDSR